MVWNIIQWRWEEVLPMRDDDEQPNIEDRATQPMEAGGWVSQIDTLCFFNLLIWVMTVTEISVKNGVWGPVEWLGDQLAGWGGATQNQNLKINALCFLKFLDLSDRCWDICKNSVWGPVEWVGDQLTGWGGSSQNQNSKKNAPRFLNFLDLSDRYRDICWKRFYIVRVPGFGETP